MALLSHFARLRTLLRHTAPRAVRPLALVALGTGLIADPALAQEGPIPPRDLGAIDQQLQSILPVAQPNVPQYFRAPSGAGISVRPFEPVSRRSNALCINCANPCRGYEVTYTRADQAERVVLEGFRCRNSGGMWVMVQPETIIARESTVPEAPIYGQPGLENVPEMSEEELRNRGLLPPLSPDIANGTPQSLTPDGELADGTQEGVPIPDTFGQNAGAGAGQGEIESAPLPDATAGQPGDGPPAQTAGTESGTEPLAGAQAQNEVIGGTSTTPVDTPPARQITEADKVSRVIYPGGADLDGAAQPRPTDAPPQRDDTDTDMSAALSDPGVVSRLKQLRYLPQSASGSDREQVRQAVGSFAVDEQFALPVDAAALSARLEAAAERNEAIAACTSTAGVEMICEEGK
ncbi:hypothetical protein [Amorphus sp. MBR-141]